MTKEFAFTLTRTGLNGLDLVVYRPVMCATELKQPSILKIETETVVRYKVDTVYVHAIKTPKYISKQMSTERWYDIQQVWEETVSAKAQNSHFGGLFTGKVPFANTPLSCICGVDEQVMFVGGLAEDLLSDKKVLLEFSKTTYQWFKEFKEKIKAM